MDINDFMHNFRVINPDLVSFSTSQMRISTSGLSFNIAAAAELGYPATVCLLVTVDGKGIAIQANPKDDFAQLALPFYDPAKSKQAFTKINDRAFVRALRRELGWQDTRTRKATGVLYRSIDLLYFDLSVAERLAGGKSTPKVLSLSDYPRIDEVMTRLRPAPLALESGFAC